MYRKVAKTAQRTLMSFLTQILQLLTFYCIFITHTVYVYSLTLIFFWTFWASCRHYSFLPQHIQLGIFQKQGYSSTQPAYKPSRPLPPVHGYYLPFVSCLNNISVFNFWARVLSVNMYYIYLTDLLRYFQSGIVPHSFPVLAFAHKRVNVAGLTTVSWKACLQGWPLDGILQLVFLSFFLNFVYF